MNALLVLAAVAVGMLLPIQPGVNATLSRKLGSAWHGATTNFLVGLLAISVMLMLARPGVPSAQRLASAPWWAWTGGLMGALFVTSGIMLAPRLGAVLFVASILAGQAISSAVLDSAGAVGFAKQPLNVGRISGLLLIVAGLVVIHLSTHKGEGL